MQAKVKSLPTKDVGRDERLWKERQWGCGSNNSHWHLLTSSMTMDLSFDSNLLKPGVMPLMHVHDLQRLASRCNLHRSTQQEQPTMSSSSDSSREHNLACSNPNSCHPILLCLGLAYVFFLVLYLVGSTCFDRRRQVAIGDVESDFGRRRDGKRGGFK